MGGQESLHGPSPGTLSGCLALGWPQVDLLIGGLSADPAAALGRTRKQVKSSAVWPRAKLINASPGI